MATAAAMTAKETARYITFHHNLTPKQKGNEDTDTRPSNRDTTSPHLTPALLAFENFNHPIGGKLAAAAAAVKVDAEGI